MSKSNYFMVPQQLISVLLIEWLGLSDIARLDSACCATAYRDVLLEVLRSPQNVFGTTDNPAFGRFQFLKWSSLRYIKLLSACICCTEELFDLDIFCKFLCLSGLRLKELMITMFDRKTTMLILLLQKIVLYSPDLESLCIKTFHQPDCVLHLVCQLTKLRKLDIQAGKIVSNIERESKVQVGAQNADLVAPAVAPLPLLRSISLTTTYRLHQPFFLAVLHLNPAITHLKLDCADGVDAQHISRSCPNLQSLTLVRTDIGARNMIDVSVKCPHITALHFEYYWCGGDSAAWETVFQHLSLHTLSVNYCSLNDTVISYIGTYLHSTLTTLHMCGATGHSDMMVYWNVLKRCTLLHTLAINAGELLDLFIAISELDDCNDGVLANISTLYLKRTDEHADCTAISSIHALFPNLCTLYVQSSKNKVMVELVNTVKHCTQLRTLYVKKIEDGFVRTMRKINPYLLVYVASESDWL